MLNELIVEFVKNEMHEKRTNLCDIFKQKGSDKSTWHNYSTLYDFLFKKMNLIDKPINFFELGLGTNNTMLKSNMGPKGIPGASLFSFVEYFKNANIFGADIDKDILFQTEKIKTFYCDQTDKNSIDKMWNQIDESFDVIIDDGLHEADANIIFHQNSFHKLKDGGIFIIEDILNEDLEKIYTYMNTVECNDKILIRLPITYKWTENDNEFRGRVNTYDNNLAIMIK